MRVLVCGGRDYSNWEKVKRVLKATGLTQGDTIIEGGARGADSLAATYATANGIELETYLADWDTYGKAAGYIRNKTMLEDGKPDHVVAFPGGRGTKNMIELATKANIPVSVIHE